MREGSRGRHRMFILWIMVRKRLLPSFVLGLLGLTQWVVELPDRSVSAVFQEALDSVTWMSLLAAEDSRAPRLEDVAVLERALGHDNAQVRQIAVRALGRLERSSLVPSISPMLSDPDARVRKEAANALGQAVYQAVGDTVLPLLANRLSVEADPAVRGVLVQTMGRLAFADSTLLIQVEATLRERSESTNGDELLGVARGYESLVRLHRGFSMPFGGIARLTHLSRFQWDSNRETAARIRRLALGTALRVGAAGDGLVGGVLDDPDAQVRRLAIVLLSAVPPAGRGQILAWALIDSSASVRFAALRQLGGMRSSACSRIAQMANDADTHVRLLAIDLLAECGDLDGVEDLVLGRLQLPTTRVTWHEPAHALVALAAVDSAQARSVLPAFTAHQISWVRVYAAQAASRLGDTQTLEQLAFDDNDNVRQAAVAALSDLVGQAEDSIYIAQLARDDYQLIMAAARALEGSPTAASALPLLLIALRRITLEDRESSRDPRMALLERIGEFGDVQHAKALEPYLSDFDPIVAQRAATIMGTWTGGEHLITPRAPLVQPRPTLADMEQLAASRPVLVLQGGGEIELQLFPFEAPTNVARFARLARAGYFDGLTFHRVVPGFVIQGGSPGANEFMGDGSYTRDELGLRSHVRGTVGVSTRGRDTGDGQIFVNLVDNARLDHKYTIFADVIAGMDVVDAALEGGVIERIEWRE